NSTLEYQYDFGSTTELSVSKLDIYSGTSDITEKINLLARNTEPLVPCDECEGRKATQICCECQWDGGGWLCDNCAPNHECGDEMFLPVVNSPRTGVCGYVGGRTELDSPPALFKDRSTKSRRQQPKKGQSATGKKPTSQTNSSTENLKMERTAVIGEMIRDFADQHLSEELEGYALKLTDTLSRTDTLNIARGKTEIWAAAIVYVIARLNFLFDRDHEDHIAADTICDFFNTKKATVGNKATLIEDACGLVLGDEEYCSRDISELLTLVQSPSSLFFPESMFPDIDLPSAADMSEIQELSLLRDSIEQLKADLPKHLRKDFSLIIEPVISEIAAEFGLEIPILKKVMRELGIEIDEVDMPDSFEPDRKGGRKAEIIELDEFRAEKEKERQAANRQKQGEEQQKITDAEKSKIDSGQLSIFDDDE
ncbi:MAG: hypothetical protein GY866_38510, partial [Proteobacteria bacterium]|nr:hypothetical protein [Pseudomonadota bacterium]